MEEINLQLNKQYVRTIGKWMKFFGILMIICCVFMVLISICCFAGASFLQNLPNASDSPLLQFPVAAGVLYLLITVFYIIPTIYMFRASKAAIGFSELGNDAEMTSFLQNNKSLWKFMGIVSIVALSFAVLCLIIVIIAAFVAL